jgi:hypothetical protein
MRLSEIIKSRVDIVELALCLGHEVRGNRTNAVHRNGKKFSVSIDRAKGTFKDHVSGDRGTVIDLVMLRHGCDAKAAITWLADHCGVTLRRQEPGAAARYQAAQTSYAIAIRGFRL